VARVRAIVLADPRTGNSYTAPELFLNDPGRVLILGAGPTGLGAAYRLQELAVDTFTVLEATERVGGLASSDVDAANFTWDVGGHVQFSHYTYYDDVLDRALGDGWLQREREAWIWMRKCWIPYPFQYNLHRLPEGDRQRAVTGLEEASRRDPRAAAANLRDWAMTTFGDGIAELFLLPYNEKVWGFPLETLGVDWIGERVAVPDLERVQRSLRENRDDISWGPNHQFRYPRQGGTGAIWSAVANLLRPGRLALGAEVERVDLPGRRVHLRDGRRFAYDRLISSLPLDVLVRLCEGLSRNALMAARDLRYSSCHILGIGLRGDQPSTLRTKCWIYFPESHSPYYRVTVLSNYSPFNVPPGPDHWSLMAEVCESASRPVNKQALRTWTLQAMREDGLIGRESEVVSFWHRREEHGYPTPFRGRDEMLAGLLPELERHRVYSRGRFGAWKYEVSNQDHSFMQGVEVVNRILGIGDEPTLTRPAFVNAQGALQRRAESTDR
jgi:protoporphyrinogen oxidase